MAYNGYYQQMYQQMQPMAPMQQMQQPLQQVQSSGIIWVSGEAGAKAFLVAPNSTVQLWDSESQTIYLKSADSSGMPSIKVLDYTIRGAETQAKEETAINLDDYVTKKDLDAFEDKIKKQIRKLTRSDDDE